MAAPANPSWPPSLADVAPRHALAVPPVGEPDWLALPACPGVAVFEDAHGRAVLVAATADLRALARRRLGAPEDAEPAKRARTDHRAVTSRFIGVEVGSALEAEALYLHEARARMPDTHRVVSERWRAWFLHVDPDAEHPQWTKTNLLGLVAPRSASTVLGSGAPALPRGLLIGPIADKDTAGRLIERTIDAFDLCRYHHLLVQAPHAAPCAYKEMGRCPAPCDGTEPMADYRARTIEAARHLTGDRAIVKALVQTRMTDAAAQQNFERAAALKQTLARLEALDAPAFAHAAELSSWRMVLVMPSPRARSVSCLLLAGATLAHLGVLALNEDDHAARASTLASDAHSALSLAPAIAPTPEQIDTIAVVSRWLHTAKARRRGEALRLDEQTDPALLAQSLLTAASRIVKRKPPTAAEPPVEERELEILSASPASSSPEASGSAAAGME